ncbi:MAG: chemotaxis protein CheW [Oligoflexales bacterium]|nr:chemotaxis protein CheW [Oligoflexales bacterium]
MLITSSILFEAGADSDDQDFQDAGRKTNIVDEDSDFLSDDDALILQEQIDAEIASEELGKFETGKMSDEEAKRLLALMDSEIESQKRPPKPKPPEYPNKKVESGTKLKDIEESRDTFVSKDSKILSEQGEMSDQGAGRILAVMDGTDTAAKKTAESALEPEEMSDEEARMLLAAMDGPEAAAGAAPKSNEMSDEEARRLLDEMDSPKAAAESAPKSNEMSDEEASRLMAGMDSPKAVAEAAPKSDEMSDEKAKMLLAAMDSSKAVAEAAPKSDEMSDEEARRLLDEMDSPKAIAEAAPKSDEMSDEKAKMLLAAMDGPEAAAEPALKPDEMSDEEARMLLAAMDGPEAAAGQASKSEEMSDEEAKMLMAAVDEASSGKSNKDKLLSRDEKMRDEEEKRLLKLMGENSGATDVKNTAASSDAKSGPQALKTGSDVKNLGDCSEIPEWEPNDFQTDPDMVNDFIASSDETMQTLDREILRLEQNPDDKSIIEEIFRGAHTLKGGGGMFGFKAIERVMHRMENLFDLIRKDKLKATSDVIDVVFKGLDKLRTLLQAVKDGKPCGEKTGDIVFALNMVAQGKSYQTPKDTDTGKSEADAGPTEVKPSEDKGNDFTPVAPTVTEKVDSKSAAAASKTGISEKKKEQSTIRVDLDRLDALVNLVGELVIDRTRLVSIEDELRTNFPHVKLSGNISETVQLFGRHMNEFQDIIMKVRMVPIGNAFNKFTRIVRDLAKSLDKKIDLIITGEGAELDKTLVEQIGDPLIHLIRNSCDHGVELPEVRTKKGKNPVGKIFLSAHQEGNQIIINIEDDGKGLPTEVIRKKGIERGLITEEDKLSDKDIHNLIFEPGFSTAEKVTNVSGRGVGMDVVKKQIMKLKGMIEIDSEEGRGMKITIRLPLTLAIVQSLLVGIQNEIFAIPLSSVIESIRITSDEIQKVGDMEVVKLRNKVLPLMHLDETLSLSLKEGTISDYFKKRNLELVKSKMGIKPNKNKHFVVVVGQPDRPFGIVVDNLLNQQEMVIKSMGSVMKDIPSVAGGAVLGNGEVVLVLDIPELEQSFLAKSRHHAA